jgi:hypothetical protein
VKEQDYEALSKGISRDMSSQAIAERLRIASELHDLARVLSTAVRVGSVEPTGSTPAGDEPRGSRPIPGGKGQ